MGKKQREEKIAELKQEERIDYNKNSLMFTTELSIKVVWLCFQFRYFNSWYFQPMHRCAFMGLLFFFFQNTEEQFSESSYKIFFYIWLFGLKAVA